MCPRRPRSDQEELALEGDAVAGVASWRPALEPLRSEATELRFETVHPRHGLAPAPDTWPEGHHGGEPETPTQAEQRLRRQVGQMVAAQVIEDRKAGLTGQQPWGYHAYNAVLKRLFAKPWAVMALAELEALIGWLERNRVSARTSS